MRDLTKLEWWGVLLTSLGMVISATVYITTIAVRQNDLKERVASLERGTTLENQKEEALKEFNEAVTKYRDYEIPVGSVISYYSGETPEGFLPCNGTQITRMVKNGCEEWVTGPFNG